MPDEIVVPPVKVFVPERMRVLLPPAEMLRDRPPLEMTPLMVAVLARVIDLVAPPKSTVPLKVVEKPWPPRVKSPPTVMLLATLRATVIAAKVPPLMVRPPVPRAVPLPRPRVPSVSVVPPLKVLASPRTWVPLPVLTSERRPVSTPEFVNDPSP